MLIPKIQNKMNSPEPNPCSMALFYGPFVEHYRLAAQLTSIDVVHLMGQDNKGGDRFTATYLKRIEIAEASFVPNDTATRLSYILGVDPEILGPEPTSYEKYMARIKALGTETIIIDKPPKKILGSSLQKLTHILSGDPATKFKFPSGAFVFPDNSWPGEVNSGENLVATAKFNNGQLEIHKGKPTWQTEYWARVRSHDRRGFTRLRYLSPPHTFLAHERFAHPLST